MDKESKARVRYNTNRGKLVAIPGTVGARKTITLKKQLLGHSARGQRALVAVFGEDVAYEEWPKEGRDQRNIRVLVVTSTAELAAYLSMRAGYQIVGIDNAHLGSLGLATICRRLAWNGAIVYVAGQTQDRLRSAHDTMTVVLALADEIWHPFPEPRCHFCGHDVAPLARLTSTQIPLDEQLTEVDLSVVEPHSVIAVPCCRKHFMVLSEDAIAARLRALGIDTTQAGNAEAIGRLEVVTGPMFSGKTATAIGMARYATKVRKHVAVFVHQKALRRESNPVENGGATGLLSHSGEVFRPAQSVANARQVWESISKGALPDLIIIDEAQFFDHTLTPICVQLAHLGSQVLVCGLSLYWYEEPFYPVPELMAMADRAHLLTAMCSFEDCDKPATRTVRKTRSGLPAEYGSLPPEDPGGRKKGYEPRCGAHHLVPGHPAYAVVGFALE